MDASSKIQRSIHDVRLTYKYVSRILGTYHFQAGAVIFLWSYCHWNQSHIQDQMRAYLCKRSYRLPAKSEPPSTRLRVVAPITIIPNICSTFKMIWIKFKKNEIIRRNTSKYSTNLSFQKFL